MAAAAEPLAELYLTGRGVKRDRRKAAEWLEKAGEEAKRRQAAQRNKNAPAYWMMRLFGDLLALGCFYSGMIGLSSATAKARHDGLVGMAYFAAVMLFFWTLAYFLRPAKQKRLPRALHFVLAGILLVLLAAIFFVFARGGVVDPVDIWIVSWIAALAALALYRGFRKKKE